LARIKHAAARLNRGEREDLVLIMALLLIFGFSYPF
jgi:hypothetical protein